MRVLHVIAEFSAHEAMGRTVVETAARVHGEHHLLTAHVVDADGGEPHFASVTQTAGSVGTFPLSRGAQVREAIARVQPDVVHLHAGALAPFQALAAFGPRARGEGVRLVTTVYAWPVLPSPCAMRRTSAAALRASNVVAARVALTTVVPRRAAARALERAEVDAVLTPDPRVLERLDGTHGLAAVRLPSGGPQDARRAAPAASGQAPTIVFAGRAESVRGLDVLLDAFPLVREAVPDARLRLLLIPRPELDAIEQRIAAAGLGEAVEVVTETVPDLSAELAAAQVGTWPFLFDYVTSPPAMAVAEAMSVGLPVVATDVACVRAVVRDEVDGLLVRPGDARSLADALVRLLVDGETWQRLADAGPVRVDEHLGWHRAAGVTEAAYAA